MLHIDYFAFVLLYNVIHILKIQLKKKGYLQNILVYKKMAYHVEQKNFQNNLLNILSLIKADIHNFLFHYKILYILSCHKLIYYKVQDILNFQCKDIYLSFHHNNNKMSIFDSNPHYIQIIDNLIYIYYHVLQFYFYIHPNFLEHSN